MTYIVIKKSQSGNSIPKFKAHYNNELKKYYYTKEDYYKDLKDRGLEPYDPKRIIKYKQKPYELSKWAKEMNKTSIVSKGKVGDVFLNEWKKKGIDPKKAMLKFKLPNKVMSGGFA